MIVIPRAVARAFAAVARRCVAGRPRGPAPPVVCGVRGGVRTLWTRTPDAALLHAAPCDGGDDLLVVPADVLCDELFKPQTVISSTFYPTAELTKPNFSTYGLGWFQQDYEGRKVDFHTGSLSGMVAQAGMIRDEKVGYFFLANKRTELRHALMYRIFDLYDEDPARDWSTDIRELYEEREVKQNASQKSEDSAKVASRIMKTKSSLSLENYSGTYEDELYGRVIVKQTGKDLRFQYGGTKGKLNHWHYDTFELTNDKLQHESRPLVNFILNSSGKVDRLEIYGREFKRVGDKE